MCNRCDPTLLPSRVQRPTSVWLSQCGQGQRGTCACVTPRAEHTNWTPHFHGSSQSRLGPNSLPGSPTTHTHLRWRRPTSTSEHLWRCKRSFCTTYTTTTTCSTAVGIVPGGSGGAQNPPYLSTLLGSHNARVHAPSRKAASDANLNIYLGSLDTSPTWLSYMMLGHAPFGPSLYCQRSFKWPRPRRRAHTLHCSGS